MLGLSSAHRNLCTIYDLLKCLQELVLWNNKGRISMTLGNNGTSEKSFHEGPVLVTDQKPEALNQTSDSVQ